MFTSIHFFASVLHYNFTEQSELYKNLALYVQGSIILALSVYLGYRETINAILYFEPLQSCEGLLKALCMIIWHIAYYGPTYWIVIQNMVNRDDKSQEGQLAMAVYAMIMYSTVNFYLSNQLFTQAAFI